MSNAAVAAAATPIRLQFGKARSNFVRPTDRPTEGERAWAQECFAYKELTRNIDWDKYCQKCKIKQKQEKKVMFLATYEHEWSWEFCISFLFKFQNSNPENVRVFSPNR